ncbi:MAG: hypothetical protein ACT4OJ_14050 [Bacteroidota bacterium]
MKSMLYVGATLMIGASIYGFVDYKQTHNKKEFKEMYAERKAMAPAEVAAKNEPVAEPEKKAGVKTKLVTKKKKVSPKEQELVIIAPIAEEDKMVTAKKNLSEEPAVKTEPAKESSAVKTVKKKKIRKEYFSRGRMPEEEVLIEKPAKKDVKKTESKEL